MIPSILYSMDVANWPSANFSRGDVRIPRVCPNCLSDDIRWNWRVDHKYPFSGTRYYQTFYFCDPCHQLMQHDASTRRIQFWLWVALFAAIIGLLIMLMDQRGTDAATRGFLMIAAIVVPTVVVLLFAAQRRAARPLPEGALGRRPAAFYTGHSIVSNKHVYRARRREWIDKLVAINPESADDKEFQERVGYPKPDTKPF